MEEAHANGENVTEKDINAVRTGLGGFAQYHTDNRKQYSNAWLYRVN